jgi:hypothetical protein
LTALRGRATNGIVFQDSSATEQMRLTSTGLGIGTTSPNFKLEVNSGATATTAQLKTTAVTAYSGGSFFAGANLTIRTGANATGSGSGIRFASDNNGGLEGMFGWVQNPTTYGDFVWQGYNGSYVERMRLDSAGNLGLGVTPSAWGLSGGVALQTTGGAISSFSTSNMTVAQNAFFDGTNWKYRNTAAASFYQQFSGSHNWQIAASGTAGNAITFTQAMTLDASGNLGVGTTSPSFASGGGLAIYNASAARLALKCNATGANNGLQLGIDTSGVAFIEQRENAALLFATNSTERARIDSSGNLLVGASSFADGSNVFRISGSTISSGSSVTTTRTRLEFNSSGLGTVGSISTNGSATTYSTSSDYRLKNTIAPMAGALAKVALLKPCTYKWNADGSNGEGFIAHELAEVCPDAVVGIKDAVDENGNPIHQGIDTSFLAATLTAAIQEQQALIQSLKARLDAANL